MFLEIEFLGYSQTFVGTLTAIFILCILSCYDAKLSESNFVLRAIANHIKTTKGKFEYLKKNSKPYRNDSRYKRLVEIINTEYTSDEERKRAMSLQHNLEKQNAKFQTSILVLSFSDQIIASPELTDAPLFSFLFALLLFFVDEIVYRWESSLDFCMSCLVVFALISYLYGIIKWLFFILKHLHNSDLTNFGKIVRYGNTMTKVFTGRTVMHSLARHFCAIFLFCICLIFLYYLFSGISIFIKNIFFWGLLIFIPISFFGFYHESLCSFNQNKLNGDTPDRKVFALIGHFFLLLLYSLLIISMLFAFKSHLSSTMFFEYDGLIDIRQFSIIFLVLNGIILPVLVPCCLITICCKKIIKKNEQESFAKTFNDINDFLQASSKKL